MWVATRYAALYHNLSGVRGTVHHRPKATVAQPDGEGVHRVRPRRAETSNPGALSGREPVGDVNDTNDEFGGVTATADGAPPVLR